MPQRFPGGQLRTGANRDPDNSVSRQGFRASLPLERRRERTGMSTQGNGDRPPRVWFVTGASSGLGKAISGAALERGDRVVASSRRQDFADAFSRANKDSLGLRLDVTDG